jgi:succinate dehydrogenase hydrophobic anchor subunit
MAELFRLLQTPGLEAVAIVFAAAFLLIRLGHALIGLAEAWDTYHQAKRLRRLSKPPGAG